MWNFASILIALLFGFAFASFVWRMQAKSASIQRKIIIAILSGSLMSIILFKAINPNSKFLSFSLKMTNETEEVKCADCSLLFFEDPCE